jgi:hypothetical protein
MKRTFMATRPTILALPALYVAWFRIQPPESASS